MTYRIAEIEDFPTIAKLHALSWQKHYRGIYSDAYLDKTIFLERATEWQKRAKESSENRNIILALEKEEIIGFSCTYLNYKNSGESLLDNIHVAAEHQGKGIGLKLMQESYDWAKGNAPSATFYLTVLKDNLKSKEFYYRFGGTFEEESKIISPDNLEVAIERISWQTRPA